MRILEGDTSIGLSGVAGVLPSAVRDLDELAAAGLLTSPVAALSALGFRRAHICDATCSPEDLALDAARAALSDAGLQPHEIDILVFAGARPESHVRRGAVPTPLDEAVFSGFRYSSAWLQHTLELHNAEVMAVAQQGCATMFAALRLARALLVAEPARRHVLCVGVDALPTGATREVLYNVISDGACAAVVSRRAGRDHVIGFHQVSKGYYWDPSATGPEIVAAYFPTSKAVVDQLLSNHGFRATDIDVVVPTGVSRGSWEILMRLVGIPQSRLQRDLPAFGHTIAADSLLHLQALRANRGIARGSRLLLFAYGFGSSWCGLLLEH
jgi:3-oxoacyl-[acyl-carrier-protein] synthase III